jgi:oligosaccharyltransferase complex subunit gamma
MISGHMWNHIRGPPYIIAQNGKVNYIAPGFSSQIGIESQIVAIICKLKRIYFITNIVNFFDFIDL